MTTPRLLPPSESHAGRRLDPRRPVAAGREVRPHASRWPTPPAPLGGSGRVLIVSNRLPATVRIEEGRVELAASSGGLATGLRGVHARTPGVWIGWSGVTTETTAGVRAEVRRLLAASGARGVGLDAQEVEAFYQRFANGVLWPVLHDNTDHPAPTPADWETYRAVNERFAATVAEEARPGDRIWVHDYHLMLVPRLLRSWRPDVRVGFFLHTPFPELDSWRSLPQAAELLDGILGADSVGVHVPAYASRLAHAAEVLLGASSALAAGSGVVDLQGGRSVLLHATPMGIDVESFAERGDAPEVREAARRLRGEGPLFVGVDRLDPTKGIPQRLEAFERLLDEHEELRGRARLLQLAVPSREDVPAYRALRARVQELVTRINARYGTPDWQPVEYRYGSVGPEELSSLYRAADVMLVTPIRDGMNLVAKEFVATRTDLDGVLVLSEHAGAAAELRAALQVDPTDVEAMAQVYASALGMSAAERRVRMRRMRARVEGHDVRRWADVCMTQLAPGQPGR